jgi:5-methyltetrahydrofolate--homocysteine methyltransferase
MAGHFRPLVQAGASIVGGCCGTTPEHVRLLVAARNDLSAKG